MSFLSPPPFMDFQSIFKSSLEFIKISPYSSVFDDIYPDSNLCIGNESEFQNISYWYEDVWRSKNNLLTSEPSNLMKMCKSYQKECLLNTNWTIVNSWENNSTNYLTQFCPQSTTTATKFTTTYLTSSIPALKPSASLTSTFSQTVPTKIFNDSHVSSTLSQNATLSSIQTTDGWTKTHDGNDSLIPKSLPSFETADSGSLKYLAFLSLVPIIIIIIIVVFLLQRRRVKRVGEKRSDKDICCSTLGSNSSLRSFPSTPTSTKNLIYPDTSERKKQKSMKRGKNKKLIPRQISIDSNGSAVYFVDLENARQESVDNEILDDPDKEKMMENWKMQLESLAEMLTRSDGNVNLAMNGVVGQEDC